MMAKAMAKHTKGIVGLSHGAAYRYRTYRYMNKATAIVSEAWGLSHTILQKCEGPTSRGQPKGSISGFRGRQNERE